LPAAETSTREREPIAVNTSDLFHAGKLREAVAAAVDSVKQHPTDPGFRLLLAELLCFAGELERADTHLSAIGQDDPQALIGINIFRQLIRADQARQGFFTEGRVPTFLGEPRGAMRLLLEASIRVREGALQEATQLLAEADSKRVKVAGTCDGQRFDDFRDLDDLTCCIFEVLTVKGDYYWIPFEVVETIEFSEPERPRDLIWRRAHLVVHDGPDAEVFIPALYPGAAREEDDQIRLGRMTDWRGGETGPVRGVGQRTFLVGEDARPMLELKSIAFDAPAAAKGEPAPG
jgi:type VI secretion system protein ImpE